MASWSIGDIERLLGVKDHVIRYWEEEIPMLAPKRGIAGRREYGERDIALLIRARHLIQDKGMGIEAAREALLAELPGPGKDSPEALEARAIIAEVRADLARLFMGETKPRP